MPLNDVAIRAAKPGLKPIKLSDERGLFLLVQPSGGKLWRLKYRIAGKEKKLSLGRYPDVALKEARERGAEARRLIAAGVDPSEKKRIDRLDAKLKAAITFKAVAAGADRLPLRISIRKGSIRLYFHLDQRAESPGRRHRRNYGYLARCARQGRAAKDFAEDSRK